MTPYELSIGIRAFNDKQKYEYEEKITLTYLGAYWQRVNKMPSLKSVLGKDVAKKEMTTEEMFKQVKQLNALFGGAQEVRENGD